MNASKPTLFRDWSAAAATVAVWLVLAAIVIGPLVWLVVSGAAL